MKKLSEICHINPKIDLNISDKTEVSFIPMNAVSEEGGIDVSQVREFKEVRKGFTYFRDGDVLFAKITPCMENGKETIAKNLKNGIGFGSTEFHILRPNNKEIKSEWIYYLLHSKQFRRIAARNMTGTAGQKRVPISFLENFKIPVPPVSVQRKITSILEKVESAREKRKEANRLTDEFLKSTFLEMFGDPAKNPKRLPIVKCGNISSHVSSGSTPLGGESTYLDNGILFIRSQNVQMNRLDLTDIACISDEVHHKMRRTWVKNGDVLLNITGASIGRVAYFEGKNDSANVNQHVCIIRPKHTEILPEYLSFLISMLNYQKKIFALNAGATRQAFNFEQIKKFEIPLASLKEQQKFADIVQKIEKLKEEQHKSEKELNNLFNSLMQKAFRGELVN